MSLYLTISKKHIELLFKSFYLPIPNMLTTLTNPQFFFCSYFFFSTSTFPKFFQWLLILSSALFFLFSSLLSTQSYHTHGASLHMLCSWKNSLVALTIRGHANVLQDTDLVQCALCCLQYLSWHPLPRLLISLRATLRLLTHSFYVSNAFFLPLILSVSFSSSQAQHI